MRPRLRTVSAPTRTRHSRSLWRWRVVDGKTLITPVIQFADESELEGFAEAIVSRQSSAREVLESACRGYLAGAFPALEVDLGDRG